MQSRALIKNAFCLDKRWQYKPTTERAVFPIPVPNHLRPPNATERSAPVPSRSRKTSDDDQEDTPHVPGAVNASSTGQGSGQSNATFRGGLFDIQMRFSVGVHVLLIDLGPFSPSTGTTNATKGRGTVCSASVHVYFYSALLLIALESRWLLWWPGETLRCISLTNYETDIFYRLEKRQHFCSIGLVHSWKQMPNSRNIN